MSIEKRTGISFIKELPVSKHDWILKQCTMAGKIVVIAVNPDHPPLLIKDNDIIELVPEVR